MIWNRLGSSVSRIRLRAGTGHAHRRQQTTSTDPRHSEWYRDMIPGMIPIALLGSSVYMVRMLNSGCPSDGADRRGLFYQGLQFARAKLSHEKQVVEAQERVSELEARLKHLESQIGNVSVERVVLEEKPTKKSWWW
jgi:hypothetical protein